MPLSHAPFFFGFSPRVLLGTERLEPAPSALIRGRPTEQAQWRLVAGARGAHLADSLQRLFDPRCFDDFEALHRRASGALRHDRAREAELRGLTQPGPDVAHRAQPPASPTSPKATRPSGRARPFSDENTASSAGRSVAGSVR